uniref:Sulfotransferase n=1 Tax=Lates calcarifer TaxID=8187 RepID=A0A4W6G5T7_LATCA
MANFSSMDLSPHLELFDFHGVSMTHYFTENWENIQTFQVRPDDILLATYPKAGLSTNLSKVWHQIIMFLHHSFRNHLGTEMADKLPTSPRMIKTHLPVQFIPKSFWEQNCRTTMVSYFHFDRMTMINPEPGDWSSYFHRFMQGKMVFGSWYDHVNSWWKKKQTYSNLHYMFYEDLVEDTGLEIDKLCCFLGLSPSVKEKERITGKVHFDDMKRNNMVNSSTFPGMDFKMSSFMRKGKVGDWKNHFTVAQSEEFDEDYKRKMKDPTLKFRTDI